MATKRQKPIAMPDWYATLTHFIKERRDKNILNIVQKAKEKPDFMLRVIVR